MAYHQMVNQVVDEMFLARSTNTTMQHTTLKPAVPSVDGEELDFRSYYPWLFATKPWENARKTSSERNLQHIVHNLTSILWISYYHYGNRTKTDGGWLVGSLHPATFIRPQICVCKLQREDARQKAVRKIRGSNFEACCSARAVKVEALALSFLWFL